MNKRAIYIIEHMEPELWEWCVIEYKHISKIIGKKNVWFTNVKKKDVSKLKKYGKVFEKKARDILENQERICILDPKAKRTLSIRDARKTRYFLFGGILGAYPRRNRTKELTKSFSDNVMKRNIGKKQFSTDNAVYTTREIEKGKEFSELKFQEGLEIQINEIESTSFPFRYNIVKGKPLISQELVKYLRRKDML